MKKSLFYLSFFLLLLNQIFAQQESDKITGKLIIAKDGISIGASKELSKGMQLDFESDGKTISVSIGGQLFSDSTISSGIGIKLSDRPCFFMTISDGIELGAIKPEGSGNGLGKLLNLKEEVIFSNNLGLEGEVCIDWLDNKALTFKPSNEKYQSVLSIPNILVDNILDFAFNFSVNPTFEADYVRKGSLNFENNNELDIDTYCLDWDLEIPSKKIKYNLSIHSNQPAYLEQILNEQYAEYEFYHESINQLIWQNEIFNNFSEKYISKTVMLHNQKTNYIYGKFYFMDFIEVFYFPYNEDEEMMFLNIYQEFQEKYFETPIMKKLENGDIIMTVSTDRKEDVLENFERNKEFNVDYILRNLNKKPSKDLE